MPTRPTVLILSGDAAFARSLTDHWPRETESPEFVHIAQDLALALSRDTYALAIADVASPQTSLVDTLVSAARPAIIVCSHLDSAQNGSIRGPMILLSRQMDDWAKLAGILGREILRRKDAEARAREAERSYDMATGEATLGRYMSEMRHNTNNALTSILGNAELLLLEPGLPASVLAQADTIRNMALRLHEIFQRFSSIEKEISVAARESSKDSAQARGAGA